MEYFVEIERPNQAGTRETYSVIAPSRRQAARLMEKWGFVPQDTNKDAMVVADSSRLTVYRNIEHNITVIVTLQARKEQS